MRDVDFQRKTVRFVVNKWRPIKDCDERTVPLHPRLETAVKTHLSKSGRTAGLLFPGFAVASADEQMITSSHKVFARAKKVAVAALGTMHGPLFAAKAIHPRMFRVTFCSARIQTLDNGRPVAQKTVEVELGQNTAAMVARVYGRLGKIRHRSEHVEYLSRAELALVD